MNQEKKKTKKKRKEKKSKHIFWGNARLGAHGQRNQSGGLSKVESFGRFFHSLLIIRSCLTTEAWTGSCPTLACHSGGIIDWIIDERFSWFFFCNEGGKKERIKKESTIRWNDVWYDTYNSGGFTAGFIPSPYWFSYRNIRLYKIRWFTIDRKVSFPCVFSSLSGPESFPSGLFLSPLASFLPFQSTLHSF